MAEQERSMRDELAQERTDLAIQRTSMAADRSLMAWIRTALSMIGFGFTIFKFLQYVRDDIVEITLRQQLPRNLGLFLIGLGTLSMIYGSIQYMLTMKSIPAQSRHTAWRFPIIAACSIAALGLFLFITMVLKIEFM